MENLKAIPEVSDAIEAYFENAKITQVAAAKQLEVSPQAVSQQLKFPFGKRAARKWAKTFDFDPEFLLTGKGQLFKNNDENNPAKKTFVPIKGIKEKIKEALLRGDIVKKDDGQSTKMQIIPREQKEHRETKFSTISQIGWGNDGKSEIPGAEFIPYRRINDVIDELEKEGYTVLSESSNCAGYIAPKLYYLAGEYVDDQTEN